MLSSLQTLNFKWVEKKEQLTVDSTIKIDQIDDSIHVKKHSGPGIWIYVSPTHPSR